MSREMTLIVLGLLTMITPYIGVPSMWRTLILVLLGAAVAVIGFLMRSHTLSKPQRKTEHHTFEESKRPQMSDVHPMETLEQSDTVSL